MCTDFVDHMKKHQLDPRHFQMKGGPSNVYKLQKEKEKQEQQEEDSGEWSTKRGRGRGGRGRGRGYRTLPVSKW